MAVAVEEHSETDEEWLRDRYTFPVYTDEQKSTFLSLYIRTHRNDLHPILLESLIYSWLMLKDEMRMEREAVEMELGELNLKGMGPRGRHARKCHD